MHRQLDFSSCFFSKKFDSLLLFKFPSTATGPTPSSTAVVTPGTRDNEGPSTLITAISAGIGGILVVCVLVAVTVVAAVVYARRSKRRRREEGKKPDVPVLQVPPPISPREGISSPR